MYCRKCGKQIADDAAFCSACGTSTKEQPTPVPTQHSILLADGYPMSNMSHKEKTMKSMAIGYGALLIGWILVLTISCIASEFRFAAAFFTINGASGDRVAKALNDSGYFTAILIVFSLYQIFPAIKYYILPFVNRNFSDCRGQQLGSHIGNAVIWIFLTFGISLIEEEIELTDFGVMMFILAAFFEIIAGITYHLAAKAEEQAKNGQYSSGKRYRSIEERTNESTRSSTWICPECGATNLLSQSSCKTCGKYK